MTAEDSRWMTRALSLARRGIDTVAPNPAVGCVIVADGQMVGEGWHQRAGTAHAEILALQMAGARAAAATAYVTLEPCCHFGRTGPCTTALITAGIRRVVIAMLDPDRRVAGQGVSALRAAGLVVDSGLLEASAEALNPGYLQRTRVGRPWVRCKMAMSLDGRTAMASGESQWITSPQARQDVQHLRARSTAIMTGIETVLADNPSLIVRLPSVDAAQQPLRIVCDSRLRMPATARLLHLPGQTVIAHGEDCLLPEPSLRQLDHVQFLPLPLTREGRIELPALIRSLAQRGVNDLLVESGQTLAGALLVDGLIDEFWFYMAPRLLGNGARGLLQLPGISALADTPELSIVDCRAVGPDWRLIARPVRGEK